MVAGSPDGFLTGELDMILRFMCNKPISDCGVPSFPFPVGPRYRQAHSRLQGGHTQRCLNNQFSGNWLSSALTATAV